jgi:hypothetical protein
VLVDEVFLPVRRRDRDEPERQPIPRSFCHGEEHAMHHASGK